MHWIRFERGGRTGFGTLRDGVIQVHEGDMFASPRATDATVPLADVTLLTPCVPTKIIALWNNFHALAAKLNLTAPPEPLYLLKAPNSFLAGGQTIRVPASYTGKVVYEGELGVVIGKRASNVAESEATQYIFGYTCSNDVTAAEIIQKDPTFAQWTRAKGFDTFCPVGPHLVTGLEFGRLEVQSFVNGEPRQNGSTSDLIFSVETLVKFIAEIMTLHPGDLVSTGTPEGVGPLVAGDDVEIRIEQIGSLINPVEDAT